MKNYEKYIGCSYMEQFNRKKAYKKHNLIESVLVDIVYDNKNELFNKLDSIKKLRYYELLKIKCNNIYKVEKNKDEFKELKIIIQNHIVNQKLFA